ncbi:hypothetical protein SynMINOS11_00649 [Synechococcus sp. Minos11]|nr:hypothetical protein SynMINOS11_00649 [Synechococcus sp. Minos11]
MLRLFGNRDDLLSALTSQWADEQLRLPSPEQRRPKRFRPIRRRPSSGASG